MKFPKYKYLSSLLSSFLLLSSNLVSQSISVSTLPVGYVTWTINPGSGSSRAFTTLSLPLYQPSQSINGISSGVISSVSPDEITVSNAGWSPSQLSNAATPYCLKITSGSAEGRTLLISTSASNTTDTVVIDLIASNIGDLTTLDIELGQDTFDIIECDTLGSLFGSPSESDIIGAEDFSSADNIYLLTNGSWAKFYYNTNLNRWTKLTLGSPDATDQPILPDGGILYSRLASTPMELIISGTVPNTPRQLTINRSGVTFIGSTWPVGLELTNSGISQISGWQSSVNSSDADKVYMLISGSWQKFYHDGTDWRRITLGNPIANNQSISSGSAIMLQKNSALPFNSILVQDIPYSL